MVSRYTVAKIDKVDTDVSTAESRNGASEVLTLTDLDGDNSNDYYDKYDDARRPCGAMPPPMTRAVSWPWPSATASSAMKSGSYEAEAVTGEVTAFREDETVTMDGTKYEFARSKDGTDGFVDGITKNLTSTRSTPST